jgi:hypothetical protein
MGGVVNTISDVVGGAADAVGSAVDFVANNADVAIPIIAAAVTGDPLLAADTFGSSTAADIAANEAASAAFADAAAATAGAGGITDIPFDGPTIPTDIPYDGPTTTAATSGVDQPFDGPTLSNPSLWNKFTGAISNLTPSSATISNVFDTLGKVAPLAGAGLLGKLAYSDQSRINDSIVKAYNDYLSQQAGIRSGYGVTAGPQLLNYTRNATPLAQAPLRTVADVVNVPKKADGGILSKNSSNMLNEYMNIRNQLKKYKTGGRAHYAMGSSTMPMQQTPNKQKLKELFTKRPDILKKVLALKAQHETGSGQSSMGLKKGGIPEIDYRDKGGYVPPIGKKERADDIPAMLSNNEFVFTANAVRNAGGGDVKAGAKKMYALMKQLEKGMA